MGSKKIKQMDSYNKNKSIFVDTEKKLVVTRRGRALQEWDNGRCKLLGVRQAHSSIVQHREYSQCFAVTVNGK